MPLEESSEGEGQPSPWEPCGPGAAGSAFAGSGLSGCLNFRARSRKQPASVKARVKPRLGTLGRLAPVQMEVEPRPVSEVFKNMDLHQWRWFMQSFTDQIEALMDNRRQQSCRQRLGASNVFGSAPVRF
eukprot:jgi/Astpho2/1412/Aster-06262